jgi:hypothetical protein
LPIWPALLIKKQLVKNAFAPECTRSKACSPRWLAPGEKLKFAEAPAPVMMAPLAVSWAELPRSKNPPHAPACCSGATRVCAVKTTGASFVPLITVWPVFVIFTEGSSNTIVPAPIVNVFPAETVMLPVT